LFIYAIDALVDGMQSHGIRRSTFFADDTHFNFDSQTFMWAHWQLKDTFPVLQVNFMHVKAAFVFRTDATVAVVRMRATPTIDERFVVRIENLRRSQTACWCGAHDDDIFRVQ
jgi:hypothetical protein